MRLGAWMAVDDDDLVHAGRYPGSSRTICGLAAIKITLSVTVGPSKLVTCPQCAVGATVVGQDHQRVYVP